MSKQKNSTQNTPWQGRPHGASAAFGEAFNCGLTIVRGWCDRPLGEKPGPRGTSHGICPECYAKQLAEPEGLKVSRQ